MHGWRTCTLVDSWSMAGWTVEPATGPLLLPEDMQRGAPFADKRPEMRLWLADGATTCTERTSCWAMVHDVPEIQERLHEVPRACVVGVIMIEFRRAKYQTWCNRLQSGDAHYCGYHDDRCKLLVGAEEKAGHRS